MTDEMPKSLGACADELHRIREIRRAMEKEVAEVKRQETALENHILDNLSKSKDTTGVAGRRYRAQRVEKDVPTVKDWSPLWAWIQQTGRFDVLQKRIAEKAVAETLETEDVPGVEMFTRVSLSLTKI